jgi:hypothetical protein
VTIAATPQPAGPRDAAHPVPVAAAAAERSARRVGRIRRLVERTAAAAGTAHRAGVPF